MARALFPAAGAIVGRKRPELSPAGDNRWPHDDGLALALLGTVTRHADLLEKPEGSRCRCEDGEVTGPRECGVRHVSENGRSRTGRVLETVHAVHCSPSAGTVHGTRGGGHAVSA